MALFRFRSVPTPAAAAATLLTLASLWSASPARAEPASCLLPDPSAWPAVSKPYFMLLVDTSGSMILPVAGAAPSCGYPSTRMGHAKCAVKNTTLAFGGEVNFGLAQYAGFMTGCGPSCYGNNTGSPNPACLVQCFNAEITTTSQCGACGPMDNVADPTTRHGGNILVGMQIDNVWNSPPGAPNPSNNAQILQYVDNNCTSNLELTNTPIDGPQYGKTPINGALRDMRRYFQTGWTNPDDASITFPTPLNSLDRSCRSVNIILLTDGDETCDTQASAVSAAATLFNTGVTVGANTFKIKTHVINFAGGTQANTDAIAAAGGTTASYFATNEVQLSQALANIVSGAIKPETCDNKDNNCNGCTDEGFKHYCDSQPVAANCCAAATSAARTACLASYTASITAANPQGNLALLPCTTAAQQADPLNWLCYDPGEKCDNVDNNCSAGTDEGITKCGSPLHCPQAETCNGQDDNCDGLIDEGGICPNACAPSAEVCDGCDNDCDGVADDGIAAIPCGFTGVGEPAWCAGTITCKAAKNVPVGTCAAGGGFNACSIVPQAETCNNLDDNCNGIIDDGVPSIPCVPAGAPAGLDYGVNSACKQGQSVCTNGATTCTGWVGPGAEICDGVDNDCDGLVDETVPGAGLPCGVNQLPCTPGTSACVNGALVCQGGLQPQPETCNGVDDNCNGTVDEAPLSDAPAPGLGGCWTLPGNCCTFKNLAWCPPPGGSCNDNGTLSPPCNKGSLACAGASGWICQNPKNPASETCDGLDNDCNGAVDDGNLPQVGQACGSSVGECKLGALVCTVGVLDCVGDVPPTAEACDGLDNDCDGTVDNGIVVGAACTVAYDTTLYPGPRTALPCQPGVLQCDGMGGQVCFGGVGPSPEVCDGIDNDCDGVTDEEGPNTGVGVDHIDGTANPFPPPAASIGDACGVSAGECKAGAYHCVNGLFACLGGQAAAPETCDCNDNDCDGVTDNPNGPGGPPLCGTGKDCVKGTRGNCQCAQPCGSGEFKCPPGQKCEQVISSETGQPLPASYCVTDPDAGCGDCTKKTTTDANGKVLCAPAGTVLDNCITPPVCTCKGQSGCVEPCSGVTCAGGLVCASFGPNAGKCAVDNCYNNPCQGCGKACNLGACVPNPCTDTTCPVGEECKPNATFTDHICVKACGNVTCPMGQACVDGACLDDCAPACAADQICDRAQTPPACVTNKCSPASCADGACCDPLTGACGNCPCEGVLCPAGQTCDKASGQCGQSSQGTGGGGATTSTGGSSATGSTGSGATGTGGADLSIWGLATGGGGCSCEVGVGATSRLLDGRLALLALALVAARRRRAKRDAAKQEVAS